MDTFLKIRFKEFRGLQDKLFKQKPSRLDIIYGFSLT